MVIDSVGGFLQQPQQELKIAHNSAILEKKIKDV